MRKLIRFVRCSQEHNEKIGVRFHRIGPYETFTKINDDFKACFEDRHWEQDRWFIPVSQKENLAIFCARHGLEIRWVEIYPKQRVLL